MQEFSTHVAANIDVNLPRFMSLTTTPRATNETFLNRGRPHSLARERTPVLSTELTEFPPVSE